MGTDPRYLDMPSTERARHGCIVTLRHQQTGRDRVEHLVGAPEAALAALALELDLLRDQGDDWRILTISTPSTVYRDLQGARGLDERDAVMIEPRYLSMIGRLDLLHQQPGRGDAGSRELPLSRRQSRVGHGTPGE